MITKIWISSFHSSKRRGTEDPPKVCVRSQHFATDAIHSFSIPIIVLLKLGSDAHQPYRKSKNALPDAKPKAYSHPLLFPAKEISRNFCPSNFSPVRNAPDHLASGSHKTPEIFASRVVHNYTTVNYPIPSVLSSPTVHKRLDPDSKLPTALKMHASELAAFLIHLFNPFH